MPDNKYNTANNSFSLFVFLSVLFIGGGAVSTCTEVIRPKGSARHKNFASYIHSQIETRDLDGQGRERFIDIEGERFYSKRDGLSLKDVFENQDYRITSTQPSN